MTFKYDLNNANFLLHDFIQGVYLNKKRHLSNKKVKHNSFCLNMLFLLLDTILLFFGGCLLFSVYNNEILYELFIFIITFLFMFVLFYIFVFMITFFQNKKRFGMGKVKVDDDGISDITDDMTIRFSWEKIELIVIKNNNVAVLSDDKAIMLTFIISDINKFKKCISKYKDKALIVEY